MSPLTKALVVIVSLLTCVQVALVVPFVAKVDDYKAKLSEKDSQYQEQRAKAQTKDSLLAEARAKLAARDEAGNAQLAAANQANQQLQMQLRDATSRASKAEASVSTLTAKLGELEQSLAKSTSITGESLAAADSLRRELAETQTRRREVEGSLDTARAELEQAVRQVQYYQEKLIAADVQAAGGAAPSLADAVEGKVTQVVDKNGRLFIEINLGSADGLVQGAELIVSRDELVGLVVVTEVASNTAVARIDSMKLVPAVGDIVFSG